MRPAYRLAAGLGLLTLARLALIGGADLIPDEAYYWTWAKKLTACYWDQPGGIAFVNALAVRFFGSGEFAVRLPAVILSLISSLFAFDLGRTCLRSDARAVNGVLLAQALPLLSMGAVLMLHDSVLGAAACAAMAFAARAILLEKPRWWWAASLAGAVALYAKFSAVLLTPGVILFAILSPKGRASLKRPEPWLAVAVVAILFAPVLRWNAQHGWAAYYAVTKLSTDASMTFGDRFASLFEYIGSQIGLVTPILFVFIVWSAWRIFARRKEADMESRLFLASMTAGIFFYFAIQALRAKVQGNWAALAWLPGSLLAADYIAENWTRSRLRKWAVGGIALAATVTILLHVHTVAPFLPIPAKVDPTAQAHGWKELAARVRVELDRLPSGGAIVARRYQTASELEYYLGPRVDVFCASYDSRGSQYDIEQDFRRLEGRDVIYVDPKGRSRKLFLHFSDSQELAPFDLGPPGRPAVRMTVFALKSFRIEGPYRDYFADPFGASLARLKERIRVGRKG